MVKRSGSGELFVLLVQTKQCIDSSIHTFVALTALVAVLAESDIVVIAKVLPSFPV
jgi:hypothetical protein